MSTTARLSSSSRQSTAAPSSTTFAPCTWPGHCLGAACASNDDCDNDWICVNKTCSPCCDDSAETGTSSVTSTRPSSKASGTQTISTFKESTATSTVTSTSTTQSATATNGDHKGLTTGSAVGIGVGIVGLMAILVGVGFWLWHRRRTKPRAWEMSADAQPRNTSSRASDKRHLVDTSSRNVSRGELDASVKPTELSSVELVELEGDSARKRQQEFSSSRKSLIQIPEQAVPGGRSPQYRFEEYEVSRDTMLPHVTETGLDQANPRHP
ncbi:hypothetical protein BDV96DRAFT_171139 [Lophiotrema nucula]|uniref:Uncharacterized protein n=1 Tax=Lophiotrema nucula TaxID=690887 RepID=A0A6A5Z1G1_9PLEO|nr:hypothetical protein BDV96DRAFT_171139 [Lophiotrema nucula]